LTQQVQAFTAGGGCQPSAQPLGKLHPVRIFGLT
jgi:hypothetical protein